MKCDALALVVAEWNEMQWTADDYLHRDGVVAVYLAMLGERDCLSGR